MQLHKYTRKTNANGNVERISEKRKDPIFTKAVILFPTYRSAVEEHLLQVPSIVVEGKVPGARVHVLDEARLLEAAQQQAFGSFGGWDWISQGPGQSLPVEQLHKVKLDTVQWHTEKAVSSSWKSQKITGVSCVKPATEYIWEKTL